MSNNSKTPNYYTALGVETVEAAKRIFGAAAVKAFFQVSALKYRMRAGLKTPNPLADIEKAIHCESRIAEFSQEEEKYVSTPGMLNTGLPKKGFLFPVGSTYKKDDSVPTSNTHWMAEKISDLTTWVEWDNRYLETGWYMVKSNGRSGIAFYHRNCFFKTLVSQSTGFPEYSRMEIDEICLDPLQTQSTK